MTKPSLWQSRPTIVKVTLSFLLREIIMSLRFSNWSRVLFPILLLVASFAHAQAVDLRAQMGEAGFNAAGLDKLGTDELAWLQRWLTQQMAGDAGKALAEALESAREEGRREIVEQHRGFSHFGSDEPISSTINGEFTGFGKGRRYRLGNGQLWEQTDTATLAGVRRNDAIVHIRSGTSGIWWRQIDGFNTRARVKRIE